MKKLHLVLIANVVGFVLAMLAATIDWGAFAAFTVAQWQTACVMWASYNVTAWVILLYATDPIEGTTLLRFKTTFEPTVAVPGAIMAMICSHLSGLFGFSPPRSFMTVMLSLVISAVAPPLFAKFFAWRRTLKKAGARNIT